MYDTSMGNDQSQKKKLSKSSSETKQTLNSTSKSNNDVHNQNINSQMQKEIGDHGSIKNKLVHKIESEHVHPVNCMSTTQNLALSNQFETNSGIVVSDKAMSVFQDSNELVKKEIDEIFSVSGEKNNCILKCDKKSLVETRGQKVFIDSKMYEEVEFLLDSILTQVENKEVELVLDSILTQVENEEVELVLDSILTLVENEEVELVLDSILTPVENEEVVELVLDSILTPVENKEVELVLDSILTQVENEEVVVLVLDSILIPVENKEVELVLDSILTPVENKEVELVLDSILTQVEHENIPGDSKRESSIVENTDIVNLESVFEYQFNSIEDKLKDGNMPNSSNSLMSSIIPNCSELDENNAPIDDYSDYVLDNIFCEDPKPERCDELDINESATIELTSNCDANVENSVAENSTPLLSYNIKSSTSVSLRKDNIISSNASLDVHLLLENVVDIICEGFDNSKGSTLNTNVGSFDTVALSLIGTQKIFDPEYETQNYTSIADQSKMDEIIQQKETFSEAFSCADLNFRLTNTLSSLPCDTAVTSTLLGSATHDKVATQMEKCVPDSGNFSSEKNKLLHGNYPLGFDDSALLEKRSLSNIIDGLNLFPSAFDTKSKELSCDLVSSMNLSTRNSNINIDSIPNKKEFLSSDVGSLVLKENSSENKHDNSFNPSRTTMQLDESSELCETSNVESTLLCNKSLEPKCSIEVNQINKRLLKSNSYPQLFSPSSTNKDFFESLSMSKSNSCGDCFLLDDLHSTNADLQNQLHLEKNEQSFDVIAVTEILSNSSFSVAEENMTDCNLLVVNSEMNFLVDTSQANTEFLTTTTKMSLKTDGFVSSSRLNDDIIQDNKTNHPEEISLNTTVLDTSNVEEDLENNFSCKASEEQRLFQKGVRMLKKKKDEMRGFSLFKTPSVTSPITTLPNPSVSPPLSGSDYSNSLDSSQDVESALSQIKEKYRLAMVQSAQLENERSQLHYQTQLLKDLLEDQEDQFYRLSAEHKTTCQELERQRRAFTALEKKCYDLQESLHQRDELIQDFKLKQKHSSALLKDFVELGETISWKDKKAEALMRVITCYQERKSFQNNEQGLVVVGESRREVTDGLDEDEFSQSKIALVTPEAAQVLQSTGEGSLDAQLKLLAEEKQDLVDQVRRLKIDLDEERKKVLVNGGNEAQQTDNRIPELQLLEIQREANKQVNEFKLKLQKSEQDYAACHNHVTRLDGQVQRLKQVSENYEKQEDEMRAEKRKIMRDYRSALDRIDELEMTNSHLEKRLDRMRASRTALTQS